MALVLCISACATTEPCGDVDARTRLTESAWSQALRAVRLVVHNPRESALSATLDCTACDGGPRQHVELAPHQHLAVLVPGARQGCECSLERDERADPFQ